MMVNGEMTTAPLSERELEVLTQIAAGASNKEIAQELTLSIHTVKVHVRNIHSKLGVQSRTEAAMLALKSGLITVPGMVMATVNDEADETSPIESRTLSLSDPVSLELETAIEPKVQGESAVLALEIITTPLLLPAEIPLSIEAPVVEVTPEPVSSKSYLVTTYPRQIWWQPIYLVMAVMVAVMVAYLPTLPPKKAALPKPTVSLPGPLLKEEFLVTPEPTLSPPTPPNWAYHTPLNAENAGLALVAFKDDIFVIGGTVIGPNQGIDVTRNVLSYDVLTKQWHERNTTLTATASIMAAVLGDKIYVPGGQNEQGKALAILQIYDPQTDTWSSGPSLPAPRYGYGLVAIADKLYLFGGSDGDKFTDTVFVYSSKTKRWSQLTQPMPQAIGYFGITALKNQVYIVGGNDGKKGRPETYLFDAAAETWTKKASLLYPRYGLGLVAVANHLFAIGGSDGDITTMSEEYDLQTNTWKEFETPIQQTWRNMGAVAVDPQFFVVGGLSEAEPLQMDIVVSYQAIHRIFLPNLSNSQPQ